MIKHNSDLLEYFFTVGDDCIGWEDIAERLGVGRTSVINCIRTLRNDGYEIESVPHRGYRLAGLTDKICDYELDLLLRGTIFEGGVHVYDHVTSTSDIADDLAAAGTRRACVVSASRQMQGRGRHGRRWFSPRDKGLWFSILLHPELQVSEFHQLTFMGAVACASYLSRHCKGISIKWPNDVLINDRKCGGILTEIKTKGDRIVYAIVGVGINVDITADDFAAEHLPSAGNCGAKLRKVEMLAGILREIDIFYGFVMNRDFAKIRTIWAQFSDIVGHRVEITHNGDVFSGKVRDVDETGALIVCAEDGVEKRAYSGDVVVVKN